MTRTAQLLLVLAALGLWVASRLPWVVATSFDGLGQPKSTTLNGTSWSTALIPLALLAVTATLAALAVRGWALRLLGVLVAAATVGMGYLGIGFWVIRDAAVRTAAADLAQVPLTGLATQRHYWGAGLVLASALCALAGAVLLVRSARAGSSPTKPAGKYLAPAARRAAARQDAPEDGMSERMIWDALDEGRDPTASDNEGR